MKNKLCFMIIMLILPITFIAGADSLKEYTAHEMDFKIFVDGIEQSLEMPIVTINERAYLPLREIGEILKTKINWNGEEDKIEIASQKQIIDEEEFTKDLRKSYEGVTKKGNRYKFIGIDDLEYESYDEYIEINGKSLRDVTKIGYENAQDTLNRKGHALIKTPLQAAELFEPDFQTDYTIDWEVFYDAVSKVWVISDLASMPGYKFISNICVVTRHNELLKDYSMPIIDVGSR